MLTMRNIYNIFRNIFLITIVAAMASGVINRADAAYTLTLSSPNPAVPAASICQGTLKAQVYSFTITSVGTSGTIPTFTGMNFTTTGTYTATDILKFQVWRNTANNLSTATQMTPDITATLGPGAHSITFTSAYSLTGVASPGTTHYFWITIDVAATPVGGHTLGVSAIAPANLTTTTVTPTGSTFAGGTQTLAIKSTNPTSATASNATVCSGSPSSLTLVGGGGGTGTVVKWYTGSCGGTLVGTGNPLVVNPTVATTYYGRYEDPAPCSNNTTCATVTVNITASVTPTVTVTTNPVDAGGVINVCSGQNVTFTVTGFTNQGSGQTYQWYNSGGPIAGATASSYASSSLANGEIIYCIMTCYTNNTTYCPSPATATSTTYSINYKVAPAVAPSTITGGLSTVCINQTGITYTTTGTSPAADAYTWTVPGGTIVFGQGTNTITVNWGSTPGVYTISVVGVNCGTLVGPPKTRNITVNNYQPSPALNIVDAAAGPTTICQYTSINFSANITDPANLSKTAVWKVDGSPQFTATNTSAAYFTYPNGGSFTFGFATAGTHTVTCEITFNGQPAPGQCYSPNLSVSNTITYTVNQNEPPTVTITSTQDTNHFCRGSLDVFTATAVDAGTGSFTWYVDGVPDGSSTTSVFNYIPNTAGVHIVYCVVHSNQHCDSLPPISNPPFSYNLDGYSNTQIVNVDPCTYYVPNSGTLGPYSTCGGAFYDSQLDPGANYTSNRNGYVTFCSAMPSQFVSITFTSMVLNDAGDILKIYSGTGLGGPLLQTFTGPLNTTSFCGAVVSQDLSGGCLTAQFQTDAGAGVAAGWVGSIACSPTTSATPAGTTCANPTIISALPYTGSAHTTQCYLNDYMSQSGICNSTYNGEDRVYQYIANGPECTSISMSGTTNSPALAIYQGCPGSGGVCLTPTPMVGNNSMQFTFPSSGTYYIIIDETSGYSTYTLNIQSFGLAPPNDLPCNAQYIDLLVNVNGNNTCTGSASEPAQPSCWTTGTMNTTWYSFTAPASGTVRIRTTTWIGTGSIGSTQIALYSGNCNSLTEINCNQAGPSCNGQTFTSSEILATGLTPNTIYYVRVDGRNNQTGNYSIVVADAASGAPQPYADGQDCVVPMSVCSSSFQVGNPGFLNTGWVCDYSSANGTCMAAGDRSSCWYVFTTNGIPGNITFTLTPNGNTDYDWELFDITSLGTDQASRITNACAQINANNLTSWVRCNWSAPILYAPCATSAYQTGMCTSASNNSAGGGGPNFSAAYAVGASVYTFLLNLSNFTQNATGFTLNFGTSPIQPVNPPSVLYWTGGANTTNWFDPVNWGNCGPPTCGTTAVITTGSSFFPVINTNADVSGLAVCRDLDIKAGATVTINAGIELDICRNFINNGTLIAAPTSTVNLINSSAQYLDGNMIGSSSFGNLAFSKSAAASSKVTLLDNAEVQGNLLLANSAFGGRLFTTTKELNISNPSPTAVPVTNIGSPTSFIAGNLRRSISTPGAYYFPVGYATSSVSQWELAKIDFGSMNKTIIQVDPNGSMIFSPANFTVDLGDTIVFVWASGFHNVHITNPATAPSANLSNPGDSYTYVPASAGTYTYQCDYHALMGMTGQFTVVNTAASRNIYSFFTPWASLPAAGPSSTECPTNDFSTMAPLNHGYWTFTASRKPDAGVYNMTLYNTGYTNQTGALAWTVMKAPTIAGPWGLNGTCNMTSTVTQTKRNSLTGFSVFASAQSGVLLPISLLNFDAVAKDRKSTRLNSSHRT